MEEFAIMNTPEGEIYNTSLLQRLVYELVWDDVRDENPWIRMTETRFYEQGYALRKIEGSPVLWNCKI